MTRGGKRKGAGRPEKEESQKQTMNLGCVRVSPMELANYRHAAKSSGMTLTAWVKWYLEQGLDDVIEAAFSGGRER